MAYRLWWLIDSTLHALRIPSNWVCDRYDRALGVYDDFAELDTTEDEFDRAFNEGWTEAQIRQGLLSGWEPVETLTSLPGSVTWRCQHMTVSGPLTGPPRSTLCNCEMQQVT